MKVKKKDLEKIKKSISQVALKNLKLIEENYVFSQWLKEIFNENKKLTEVKYKDGAIIEEFKYPRNTLTKLITEIESKYINNIKE